ncbi:ferredoxin reductase [Hoyosella sp. YIM 151337]|uniref:ferredoxin reductase n=1 Tax=Hoyosella sp. YIM 151337 TaxID=2992742 RepID=UPI0022360B53|nr:ferredoxin reductase [Hoyosella sp. YIM 151337]MCW4352121.1 ferredoxin reductase [Hoyosella sp. YIM 151337]
MTASISPRALPTAPNPPRFQSAKKATQESARKVRFSLVSLVEKLATPHALDRYLELVNPMLTVRDLRARVTRVERYTKDTVTLELQPTRQWQGFEAGQFVQVGVVVDGVRHTRCFSPANSQHSADGRIELTIKAHPDGFVSRYLRDEAQPGLVVDLSQAAGVFHLPAQRPERILLLSGGSGITPVLSMLRTLVDEGYTGDITFLHYCDTVADVPHAELLRDIAAKHSNVTLLVASTVPGGGGDLEGFFSAEHVNTAAPWFGEAQTYLCGPPPMMNAIREFYSDLGLSERLHTEEFQTAPATVDDTEDATGTIRFTGSSVERENTGSSLLEEAEDAGLSPEYGCRMGICFTCTAVKKSGCTKSLLTGEINDLPDEPIQLCVSRAVGDVDIDI